MQTFKVAKIAGFGLALAGMAVVAGSNPTFAASKTWTGEGTDNNFSTAANWSDNTAPVNGDSLVFTPLESGKRTSPENDIANLSISGISFTCTSASSDVSVTPQATQAITLTGDVVNNDCSIVTALRGNYILGADISLDNISLGGNAISYPTQGLNLNNHKLTFNATEGTVSIYDGFVISGKGTVDYKIAGSNGAGGQIMSQNTYTGTTDINVTGGNAMRSVQSAYISGFGTSTININTGKVVFHLATSEFDANGSVDGKTIANIINVKNNLTNFYSLDFYCSSTYCDGSETINVPNLNLLSNIGIKALNLKVNLSGVKTNGFCMEYWDNGGIITSGTPEFFLNAPAACSVEDEPTLPGVPNTSGNLMNNPVVILGAGIGVAAIVFVLMRQKKVA